MSQSINLIPKQEVHIQKQKKLLYFSTVFTVISLVITIVVTAILFLISRTLENQLLSTERQISDLRGQIKAESQIEIVSRNLDIKYFTLREILDNKIIYSDLFKELYAKKPDGIELYDLSVREDGSLEIRGKADAYLLVSEFMENINNNLYTQNPQYIELFTKSNLNNVTLEVDGASFSLSINFDSSILLENL